MAPEVFAYATETGTRRNLAALAAHDWRLLVNPARATIDPWVAAGRRYAIDNGAWGAHVARKPWDAERFVRALDKYGRCADWCVVPDVVADREASLRRSYDWIVPCLDRAPRVLFAVQDGMTEHDVAPFHSMYRSAPSTSPRSPARER